MARMTNGGRWEHEGEAGGGGDGHVRPAPAVGATPAGAWTPFADVPESEDAFHLEIELPGVKSKHIDQRGG